MVFGYETTAEVMARNKNLEVQYIHAKELEEKVLQRTIELREANQELVQKDRGDCPEQIQQTVSFRIF